MSHLLYSSNPEMDILLKQIDDAFCHVNSICQSYLNRRGAGNYSQPSQSMERYDQYSRQPALYQEPARWSGDRKGHIPSIMNYERKVGRPQTVSGLLTPSTIPSPPKSPTTPYFLFYKEKKNLIKEQFPEMSVTELASAAAKVWKSLNEEEKKPYVDRYLEEKAEYETKMNEYKAQYPNYKAILKKDKK